MAGTSDNYRQTDILLGAGRIYGAVGVPADTARLAIDATTLTPDSASGAVHLGGTKSGSKLVVSETWDEYFLDEFPDPVITNLKQVSVTLAGEFTGSLDMTLLERLSSGAGTYSTSSGYKQLTIGHRAIAYQGVCVVAPRADDATKVIVAHLYKAVNTAGITMDFARTVMSSTPFNFKGYAITTRTGTDTIANIWHTI